MYRLYFSLQCEISSNKPKKKLLIQLCFFHLQSTSIYPSPSVSVFPLCSCFSEVSVLISLLHSNGILTCPCTITKRACLFMLHWGITLFLCYYFFVKSLQCDLPQTAHHHPTLIIFSHSAGPGQIDTQEYTFCHTNTSVCFCLFGASTDSLVC